MRVIFCGASRATPCAGQRERDQGLRRPADREGNLRAALPARGAYPSPLRRGHSPTTRLRSRKLIIRWRGFYVAGEALFHCQARQTLVELAWFGLRYPPMRRQD
jgi:hypothetical protein